MFPVKEDYRDDLCVISSSILFETKYLIYALYDRLLFFASIFTFLSTRGSNLIVTGFSFGLLKVSLDSERSSQ